MVVKAIIIFVGLNKESNHLFILHVIVCSWYDTGWMMLPARQDKNNKMLHFQDKNLNEKKILFYFHKWILYC